MENLPEELQHPSSEDDQNSNLINTFCAITTSSRSEAQFFLESHNFDLDSAVSTFLETNSDHPVINPPAANAAVGSRSRSPSYAPSDDSDDSPLSRSRSPSPNRSQRPGQYNLRSATNKAPSTAAAGRVASRIQTFADLNRQLSGDGSDSDPDYHPNAPEYYTGGEKSGMVVQDRPKANDGDAIFNAVRNSGAVDVSGEHSRPSSSSRSFSGTARLLSGDTIVPAPQQSEERNHNIVLWNNGFTVDDGPLRRFDDPENAPFLESISRGECPAELRSSVKRGGGVKVSLSRKEENYVITAARLPTSFQGVGRTLNSTSSNITATMEPTASAANSLTTSPAPIMGLVVDQTLPITSIQLRLADGTRMVSRFNFHHTIGDIRGFIDASRPGGSSNYQLQTVGFPPKQLTELEQTIEQAGLANSVVIQKLG